MTIPFSKTTRQLEADRSGLRAVTLLILLALIAVWIFWFITADISLSSRSTAASLRTATQIEATFPAEDYFLLSEGQTADFILNQSGAPSPIFLSATVTNLEPAPAGVLVRLSLDDGAPLNAKPGIAGEVSIETGQATPLELLLRYMSTNRSAAVQR